MKPFRLICTINTELSVIFFSRKDCGTNHFCIFKRDIAKTAEPTPAVWYEGFRAVTSTHPQSLCVLQCVAVCCILLQCVAVCCSALQCVAVCCCVLPCVEVCCSVMLRVEMCCSVLQCAAVCFYLYVLQQKILCVEHFFYRIQSWVLKKVP